MDTSQALIIIQAELSVTETRSKALIFAQHLLIDGYQADQARIDAAIQAGKDAVADEIAKLVATIAERDAEIESLKNPPPVIPPSPADSGDLA